MAAVDYFNSQGGSASGDRRRNVREDFHDAPIDTNTSIVALHPWSKSYGMLKRAFDLIASAIALISLSPFLLVIAALVKISSKGEAIFTQIRTGEGGRPFKMYKFRTMVQDAEELKAHLAELNELSGPAFKIKADPRITPIGKVLRKYSLDELPQLINVLKGEMTLVGPRPPVPAEVIKYKTWQIKRLSVKPGLTCIWQVSGRNNIDFDNWVRMDIRYIETASAKTDIKLLFKTISAVASADGAY